MVKSKKIIMIILALIVIPLSIEFIFGKITINNNKNKTYVNETIKIEEGEKYQIDFNGDYFYKLNICYRTNKENNILITINDEEYSIVLDQYDSDKKITIDENVEEIYIEADEELIIENISSNNENTFNKYRYGLFFITTLILILYLSNRSYFKEKLERLFVLVSLLFGLTIIVCLPALSGYTPDDQIHLSNSYSLMDYPVSEISEAEQKSESALDYGIYSGEDNAESEKNLNNDELQEIVGSKSVSLIVPYNKIGYIPTSIAMKIAKLSGLNHTNVFRLGKIANLLIYVLVCYFAIKNTKFAKKIIFAVCLIPSSIFLASSYSLDGLTISSIILAFTLFLNKYFSNEKVDFKWSLLFIVFSIIGCVSKAIFAPLLLLPLLLKKEQFIDDKTSLLYKIGMCLVFAVMCSTFILPLFDNANVPGDFRGGIVSVGGQIKNILKDIPGFLLMFLPISVFGTIKNIFIDYNTYITGFYLGVINAVIGIVYLVILLSSVVFDSTIYQKMTKKFRLILFLGVIILGCIIFGTMYLSFTEIGANYIEGVQNRYFLPLVLIMFTSISGIFTIEDKKNLYIDVISISSIITISIFILTMIIETCCL